MIQKAPSYVAAGMPETLYSREGARIARDIETQSESIKDSYDQYKLLETGLKEIMDSPLTTLDEKMIAQFGKDIRVMGNDDYSTDLLSGMKRVVFGAIGAAMPGSMGTVIMKIADETAGMSKNPQDTSEIKTAGSNALSLHRGLSILAQHQNSSQELMAIKELGAEMLRILIQDGMDPRTAQRISGQGEGNEELVEKAAAMIEKAIATVSPENYTSTVAGLGLDIASDNLESITRSRVLGNAITEVQCSRRSTAAEKAIAKFSSNTTVHMNDNEMILNMKIAMLDLIAEEAPSYIHMALAEAGLRAGDQCPDLREQGDVLVSALETLAKNDSALPESRKLAREGIDKEQSIRDDRQAVDAMREILERIKGIETPEGKAMAMKKELEDMAEKLSNQGDRAGAVEIAEGFIEVDGFRMPRNQL